MRAAFRQYRSLQARTAVQIPELFLYSRCFRSNLSDMLLNDQRRSILARRNDHIENCLIISSFHVLVRQSKVPVKMRRLYIFAGLFFEVAFVLMCRWYSLRPQPCFCFGAARLSCRELFIELCFLGLSHAFQARVDSLRYSIIYSLSI